MSPLVEIGLTDLPKIGCAMHCRKKIGDLLIVSQPIQIIRSSLGIKIAQFVEH